MNSLKSALYGLLRKGERYTKTDNVYLFKGGFWLTLGQVISTASTFILAIAFANLLPKDTYGIYKYVLSIASIFAIFALPGMGQAVIQAVSRGFEGSFVRALKTKIKWGFLGTLASLGVAAYYYYNGNQTLALSFAIVALFIPFFDSLNDFDALLGGKKLFEASTKYNSLIKIGGVATLILTIYLTNNLFILLAAYYGVYTLLRFVFLKLALKKYPPNTNIDPQTISYGTHISFPGAIAAFSNYLDKILLFHYLGPISIALFSFAIAPVEQMKVVFKSMPSLALPKFATRTFGEINSQLYKRAVVLFFLSAGILLIYVLLAPFIYKVFFPEYIESIRYSQIYAATFLVVAPSTLIGTAISAKITRVSKPMLYIWNLPDAVLVASLFIFTPHFGILGVIISRLLSRSTVLAIDIYVWKKIQPHDQNLI